MAATSGRFVHRLARRAGADTYMRLMLISFAVSVLGTRLFLVLTGYPQIGNDTLHIAHALWGGLLLFIASLLPLLFDNRHVYTWSAVLSGVGTGLFIDEVGKFITQDNDYFFPAAAPIIYAVFLITVLILMYVRDARSRDPHMELLRALEELKNALTHTLRRGEGHKLEMRLQRIIADTDQDDVRTLTQALLVFLRGETVQQRPAPSGLLSRIQQWLNQVLTRWMTERRLRIGLMIMFGVLGALAASDLTLVVGVTLDSVDGARSAATELVNRFARIDITSIQGFILLLTRVALDGTIGVVLLLAAVLLFRRRVPPALTLAYYGLLLSLTVVNLLIFYFDQFFAAVGTLVQFVLLQAVLWYRHHYIDKWPEA